VPIWTCLHVLSFFLLFPKLFVFYYLSSKFYALCANFGWCMMCSFSFGVGWFSCQFGYCYVFPLIMVSLCLCMFLCSLQGLTLHSWRFYSAATLCSYSIWIQTPSCILLVPWNQVLKVWIQISHHRYVMPILQIASLFSLTSLVIYAWWFVMPSSPGISECDAMHIWFVLLIPCIENRKMNFSVCICCRQFGCFLFQQHYNGGATHFTCCN
jgi:hypothetical protein